MKTFPLIRQKWTNEHLMAALTGVLLLWCLPIWVQRPSSVVNLFIMFTMGLVLDAICNVIRYKRIVCSVSAGVTAVILFALTFQLTVGQQLLGLAFALIIGKHVWGGMGKNPINPAITGFVVLSALHLLEFPLFSYTWLVVPAVLLSLPFIFFRPFASVGWMTGMLLGLLIAEKLSLESIITSGVIFFGTMIITDPVTVTKRPLVGGTLAFVSGLLIFMLSYSPLYVACGILVFNSISYLIDSMLLPDRRPLKKVLRFKQSTLHNMGMLDLVGEGESKSQSFKFKLTNDEILTRIKENEVYGMGGAAFPTHKNIKSVMFSKEQEKHLIINAAECDPGLIHDKWLMVNRSKEIKAGIDILNQCCHFNSIILASKSIDNLESMGELSIRKVPDFYPIGAEKTLIKVLLGKTLPLESIPACEGYLVLNIQTLYSIYEAVLLNKKADTKFITASNLIQGKTAVVKVKLGMGIHDAAETVFSHAPTVFSGGGMMQARHASEDDRIDKHVNYIAVAPFPAYKESPQCSKCGLCMEFCPQGLEAGRIADYVDSKNLEQTKRFRPEACLQCGACSYVCLAGRNLSYRVRKARDYIRENVHSENCDA